MLGREARRNNSQGSKNNISIILLCGGRVTVERGGGKEENVIHIFFSGQKSYFCLRKFVEKEGRKMGKKAH